MPKHAYHHYCDIVWSKVTCKALSVEEGESARVDRTCMHSSADMYALCIIIYTKDHFQPNKCTSIQKDGFCGLGIMHRSGSLQHTYLGGLVNICSTPQ